MGAACVLAIGIAIGAASPGRGAGASASVDALHAAATVDDLYVFSVSDPTLVAFAITVGARVPRGPAAFSVPFDPRVLYAIHIDNVGDFRDHLTFQFVADAASPPGPRQRISVYGPGLPLANGGVTPLLPVRLGGATYNQTTILDKGATFFAGPRRDPLFFDAARFARIRAGAATCFRAPGGAENAFVNDDVLAIVIEVPKTLVAPRKRGRINVWATASIERAAPNDAGYEQVDRAGRPFVRDLFETAADQEASRSGDPPDDAVFARDVRSFSLAAPPAGAGRAPDTVAALARIFVPDELQADIEAPNPAAYLGIEVPATPAPTPTPTPTPTPPGASPSPTPPAARRPTPLPTPFRPFGGRTPSDPANAIDLRAVYGDLVAKAGLAPDDGRETPCLANDGTVAPRNLSRDDFPYLDAPL
jgi:hypothetical protein